MDLDVIVGVSTTSLSDGVTARLVAHDGLGAAPLHRLTERGPMQHGETDYGLRLDVRVFSLLFALPGSGRDDLDDRRTALLAALPPLGSALGLRFTRDNAEIRQIDAHRLQAPMGHDARREWQSNLVAVQFRAPDVVLYDPTGKAVTFALGGGGDSMEIPLAIPWEVGVSTLDVTTVVTYGGSWLEHPYRIRITGPITDAVITNQATGEKLDFTGTTIGAGVFYDVDTRYGFKTVTEDDGTNRIADLTSDSDLATWHLAAHPEVAAGKNSIRVEGTTVTAATQVVIQYFERFDGI